MTPLQLSSFGSDYSATASYPAIGLKCEWGGREMSGCVFVSPCGRRLDMLGQDRNSHNRVDCLCQVLAMARG